MASPPRALVLAKELFGSFEEESQNFLLITDHEMWEREQKAYRLARRVIALEITYPFSQSCGRIRPLFARLAEEFDGVPFTRVLTGPIRQLIPTNKICRDVGVVKELPAILLLYYDSPGHIKRKSYEGESAIMKALQNGELKRKFKELIGERYLRLLGESVRSELLHKSKRRSTLPACELEKKWKRRPHFERAIPEEEKEDDDDTECKTTSVKYQSETSKGTSNTDDDNSFREPSLKKSLHFSRCMSFPLLSPIHFINRSDIKMKARIGQGGFGTVYLAMWKNMKVAVKVCSGNLLEHGSVEIDVLASLPSHPNVVDFFGVALSEDKINTLIVTEFAIGGSLYTRLHEDERKVPGAGHSLGWAIQIASGMEFLHRHNIIHRDLKSPNVLLSHGYAKVCDFGTARQLCVSCMHTGQAGSYRWMAPEIAEECYTKINEKCDVFSYGMTLYEIYALELPFSHIKSDVRVSNEIMEGKCPSIPEKLPSFLRPLLQDCWDKEPARRPSFKMIVRAIQTESYAKEIM